MNLIQKCKIFNQIKTKIYIELNFNRFLTINHMRGAYLN